MADKNFKKDEAIEVLYQAPASTTGLTVQMDVYDEADEKDVAQSGVMLEQGARGKYKKSFTPDANGNWHIEIADDAGGKAVKAYSVGNYNVDAVGAGVATVDAKVEEVDSAVVVIDTKVTAVDSAVDVVSGKVDAVDSALTGVDTKVDAVDSALTGVDTKVTAIDSVLAGVDTQLGVVEGKIDALESPPMIG